MTNVSPWRSTRDPRLRATPHDHHQIRAPVPGSATKPSNLPFAEARPDRDRRPEAKELGFQLHEPFLLGPHIHSSSNVDSRVVEGRGDGSNVHNEFASMPGPQKD